MDEVKKDFKPTFLKPKIHAPENLFSKGYTISSRESEWPM